MFYQEHGPPHFHAEHQGDHASFTFDGEVLAGAIRSARARHHIRAWATAHRPHLEANWVRALGGAALERIEPLE
ncbi:MAG: DUF4160 domain-containing protein [Gemmatimonadaceae bacterium]